MQLQRYLIDTNEQRSYSGLFHAVWQKSDFFQRHWSIILYYEDRTLHGFSSASNDFFLLCTQTVIALFYVVRVGVLVNSNRVFFFKKANISSERARVRRWIIGKNKMEFDMYKETYVLITALRVTLFREAKVPLKDKYFSFAYVIDDRCI